MKTLQLRDVSGRRAAILLVLAGAAVMAALALLLSGGSAAQLFAPFHPPEELPAVESPSPLRGHVASSAFSERRLPLSPEVGDRFVYRFVRSDEIRVTPDRDGMMFRSVDGGALGSRTTTEGELVATVSATEGDEVRWSLELTAAAVSFSNSRGSQSAPVAPARAVVRTRAGAVDTIGLPKDSAPDAANLVRWLSATLFQWKLEAEPNDHPAEVSLTDETGRYVATFAATRSSSGEVSTLVRRKLRYEAPRDDEVAGGAEIRVVEAFATAALGVGWLKRLDESQRLEWSGPELNVDAESVTSIEQTRFEAFADLPAEDAALEWSPADRRDHVDNDRRGRASVAPLDAVRAALSDLLNLDAEGLHSAAAMTLLFQLTAAAVAPDAAAELRRAILSGELGAASAVALGALADAARESDAAASELAALLTDDRADAELREALLMSVHELGPRSAAMVDAVLATLAAADRSALGETALLALGSLAACVQDETTRARLREALDAAERGGADLSTALLALGNEGDPARIAAAAERHATNADPAVRRTLADLLGDISDTSARRVLDQLTEDTDSEVQKIALAALGRQTDDVSSLRLHRFVMDASRSDSVRMAALRGLGKQRERLVAREFIASVAAGSASAVLRTEAADLLNQ